MTPTDAHRRVYDLLVNRHARTGLSREELAAASGLSDRTMRKVLEELRVIAVEKPHPTRGPIVIGYDPELGVYAAARSREQAERITKYYRAFVQPMLEALRAQERAISHYRTEAEQDALFTARRALDRGAWS